MSNFYNAYVSTPFSYFYGPIWQTVFNPTEKQKFFVDEDEKINLEEKTICLNLCD